MKQTYVTLNNRAQIPQFGLGVYMVHGDAATKPDTLSDSQLLPTLTTC